jgi:predicted Zn-dependent peptidase
MWPTLAFLALAAQPAAPTPVPVHDPQIPFEKYTLKNGLEVVLSQDRRVPLVHVQVWYHVGSKDERPGKTGFAHLFEHMMFQGSRDIAEDTWFKKLDAVGAYGINGTTNTERTNYFESLPSNQLALALWMESDRMGFLLDHVNEASFRNQQDVVRNERRQSYEMRPYGMIYKETAQAMFPPSHPYHHTTIGEHEDLARATVEEVKTFFRTYYVPSNATLTIVGDFDIAQAKALVEQYFGTLPSGPSPARQKPTPVVGPVKREVKMEANVQLARLDYSWHAPTPFAADEPELDLLAMVLASGKTSRLYKRLVYDLRVCQSISADLETREYGGEFNVEAMIKPGHSIDEIRGLIDEEMARIRREPVAADELARAKTKIEANFIRVLETNQGRAQQLQYANHYTKDPGAALRELARYRAVTAERILKAASHWLPDDRRFTISFVPNKDAPLSGREIASVPEKKQ